VAALWTADPEDDSTTIGVTLGGGGQNSQQNFFKQGIFWLKKLKFANKK
jgi:hypothetical protein